MNVIDLDELESLLKDISKIDKEELLKDRSCFDDLLSKNKGWEGKFFSDKYMFDDLVVDIHIGAIRGGWYADEQAPDPADVQEYVIGWLKYLKLVSNATGRSLKKMGDVDFIRFQLLFIKDNKVEGFVKLGQIERKRNIQ